MSAVSALRRARLLGAFVFLGVGACMDAAPRPDPAPADSGPLLPVETGFSSADTCAGCHPRQYTEWTESMHRYGAVSPVMEAMNAKVLRDSGGVSGTFCTNCHNIVGTREGEPGGLPVAERSALSREGITCDVCHTAVDHGAPVGNANLVNEGEGAKLGPYDDPDVEEHEAEASGLVAAPELCGTCHDVFMFPGLRLEEAYTEYVSSPAAEAGVRCQDCHMSPDPGVAAERPLGPSAEEEGRPTPDREQASHRFVGPDYSLLDSFPYADDPEAAAAARAANLVRIQQLLDNAVRLRDLAVTREDGALAVSVSVESLVSGHNVPTGFTSERQLWVAVTVTDAAGAELYTSGDLDANLDLRDEHSAAVAAGVEPLDADLVNFQSRNVVLRREYEDGGEFAPGEEHREQTTSIHPHEADFIEKHSLAPLEIRALDYAVALPPDTGAVTVRVALRFRNLPPYLLRDLQLDALVERLVVFTVDESSVDVP